MSHIIPCQFKFTESIAFCVYISFEPHRKGALLEPRYIYRLLLLPLSLPEGLPHTAFNRHNLPFTLVNIRDSLGDEA